MASLVSPTDVKALINTAMTDVNLQKVIDRVEAQINAKIGPPQTDAMETEIVKVVRGEGFNLFMPTEIYAVVSIMDDDVTLTEDEYQIWSAGVIERLPINANWGGRIVVTYKPVDDRAKRTEVIIDLVRLVIERTAMKSESVAGEYSYTAPENWEAEFRRSMKRLTFQAV